MTAELALTPDDWRHTALVDEIATEINCVLLEHDWTVHAAVLAMLLGRYLVTVPPVMRGGVMHEHCELARGLVELFELQAADRQAN